MTVECPEAKLTTRFVSPRKVIHLHDRKVRIACTRSFVIVFVTCLLTVQLLSGDVLPSGGLGVCCSEEGQLWVWDTDTGKTRVGQSESKNLDSFTIILYGTTQMHNG